MASQFVNLPAPAGNGSGAAVNVSSFGGLKTVTVTGNGGVFEPFVTIELSNEVAPTGWAPIVQFTQPGTNTFLVAARWMRATVSNYKGGGAPTVEMGGNDDGSSFATLVAPARNGSGVGVDTSALPAFKTIHVADAFRGALNIEVSEDAGNSYSTIATFNAPGMKSLEVVAEYMRVTRVGVPDVRPGQPIVNIGATTESGGSAGGVEVDNLTIVGTGEAGDPLVGLEPVYFVTKFGAVGNGIADDTVAIQNAITRCQTDGRGLHFPPGTYKISATLNITASGLRITGVEATVRFPSVATVPNPQGIPAFTLNNCDRVTFSGLKFQGDRNDRFEENLGPAIQVSIAVTNTLVERCKFLDCIPLQAYDGHLTRFLHFDKNYVNNAPGGLHPCSDSKITNNDFICDTWVSTRAQAIYAWGQQANIEILGNTFKNISTEDIQIRSTSARWLQRSCFRIANNHFENSAQYSIWAGSDDHPQITSFVIANNTFRNCQGPIACYSYTAEIVGNHMEWDFEFPYTLPSAADAIIASTGLGTVGHYQIGHGVHIHGNTFVVRHPYVGKVTINAVPANGDQLVVGEFTYTWRTAPAAAFDIQIAAGNIRQCTENLCDTLRGNDGRATAPTNVIRFSTDIFNNYYGATYGSGADNVCVIVSWFNYNAKFSATGAWATLTAVVDYRGAVARPINAQVCDNPIIESNEFIDFAGGPLMQQCYSPRFLNNRLMDNTGVASPYAGDANVFSIYRGNEVIEYNRMTQGRLYFASINDGFSIIEDDFIRPQQLTTPWSGGRFGLTSVGDGKAWTLYWFGNEVSSPTQSNSSLLFRWNEGDQVKLWTGGVFFNYSFKRTAPGANQFNSADSLVTLINGSSGGTYTAAYVPFTNDLGALNPKLMILIKAAAGGVGGNAYRVYTRRYKTPTDVATYLPVQQPRIVGQMLRDVTGLQNSGQAEEFCWFYGGSATLTKTWVFTPLANRARPVYVQGVDATSRALNPFVDLADIVPGVGFMITHGAAAGTEQFLWRVG